VEISCECSNNLQLPLNAGKFLCGCTTGGLSSSAQLHTVVSYIEILCEGVY
jgi:hypothetical protein